MLLCSAASTLRHFRAHSHLFCWFVGFPAGKPKVKNLLYPAAAFCAVLIVKQRNLGPTDSHARWARDVAVLPAAVKCRAGSRYASLKFLDHYDRATNWVRRWTRNRGRGSPRGLVRPVRELWNLCECAEHATQKVPFTGSCGAISQRNHLILSTRMQ